MLKETALYLGDNGRMFCGTQRCAGHSAFYSGRTIAGQRVAKVTEADAAYWRSAMGEEPKCEGCGRERSRIVVAR